MLNEMLNQIIQDNTLIKTQVGLNSWESSIIISHTEDVIQISLIQDYYKMALMAGDMIRCKYVFEGKEYLIEGKIEKVMLHDVPSLFIKITNIESFENKRKSERMDIRLGANIRTPGIDYPVYSIINNMSLGGVGIIIRTEIDVGSEVTVEMLLEYQNLLRFKGRVIRCNRENDYYNIGIKVDEGDSEGIKNLEKVFNKYRKIDEALIEETIENLNKGIVAVEKEETVMVVDDNDFMRLIISKLLSLHGFSKVLGVTDGPEAIAFAQKLKPDIIILDLILPTMNGDLVMDEIKKVSPDSKVVVVSTVGSKNMIVQMKAKGAIEYIVKPFDNKQLIDVINRVC